MHRCLTTIIAILFMPFLSAQNGMLHGLSGGVSVHYGFMLPEYQFINYLVDSPVRAAEISLYKQTTGKNPWEQIYRYPAYGVSFMYSGLGNHRVFGEYSALWPWYRIYFIDTRNFSLQYRLGLGACYVNRLFDPADNYADRAIGSKLNIFFNMETGARVRLMPNLWLSGGMGFSHLSNANLREPNFGLNDLTFFGGLEWNPRMTADRVTQPFPNVEHPVLYSLILSAAPKHARSRDDNRYLVTSLSFDLSRLVTHKLRLGGGADLFYDTSTQAEMEARLINGYRARYDYRLGLHISQEFMYDRMSLIFQEGCYLLLKDRVTGWRMYTRGVIQYRFGSHMLARLSMKSHFLVLDHPELGVGYCW